jgi:ATP-binding cassette subfamily F protein 3
LEEALADPAVYQDDAKDRLKSLLVDRGRVDRILIEVEAGWMAAGERLERIQAEDGEE